MLPKKVKAPWEPLTYARARTMLGGRKFRRLGHARLYRGEGESFTIKLTSWSGKDWDNKARKWVEIPGGKRVFEPPVAVLYPHDVVVLNDEAKSNCGENTVYNVYRKLFGLMARQKTDPRSSVKWWWHTKQMAAQGQYEKPFASGMQFDIINGVAITEIPPEQRRRVNTDAAKPIRDRIRDWDKFASTYFSLIEWTSRHHDLLQRQIVAAKMHGWVPLEEEPSEVGLYRILGKSNPYDWYIFKPDHMAEQEKLTRVLKRRWATAFEKWKQALYAQHGAYTWTPAVDKLAA